MELQSVSDIEVINVEHLTIRMEEFGIVPLAVHCLEQQARVAIDGPTCHIFFDQSIEVFVTCSRPGPERTLLTFC